jgi:hypothetical protein
MAAKRLKSWIPQVNPDDPSHIDAYLLAKMQNQRVSVSAVLAIINQQDLSVERSTSQEARFYVVPRTNLPKGLSTVQKQWLVTKDELMARYEVQDDDTDYDTVYVFSDGCPREALGRWVHQKTFCLKLGRTSRARRTAALPDNTEGASRSVSSNDGHVLDADLQPPEKKRQQRGEQYIDGYRPALLRSRGGGPHLQHRQDELSHIALLGERSSIGAEEECRRKTRHRLLCARGAFWEATRETFAQ